MKTVITYAYHENSRTMYNLDYFIQVGMCNDPNLLYIFVINGNVCNVDIVEGDNCVIIRRDNVGYDFGAHRASIDYLINLYGDFDSVPYDNYIFLNCGVIGPFLPSYYPSNIHWSNIFTSKLNDKVKLVGTSLVCFEYKSVTGQGPHIEGFCFCLDKIGLKIVMDTNTVFVNHLNKHDAINNGEYGLSKCILKAGYSLDCLLYKYQNIDWSNKQNWTNHNNYNHPSRNNTYDNITLHPFETVFHKWYWVGHQPVNFNYVVKYRKWKLENIIKSKQLYATFGIGEYMTCVTSIVMNNFVNDNIITIPVDYYLVDSLKKISDVLGSDRGNLNIYIYGILYTIPHTLWNPINIHININQFHIKAFYGCMDFKIDVSHKFINTFVQNNFIIIPKKYNFNNLFTDVCPKKIKHIYLDVNGKSYNINEFNPEIKIEI
jgi:hypothetical protein